MGASGFSGFFPAAQLDEHGMAMWGKLTSAISLDSGPSVIPTTWAPNFWRAFIYDGLSN